MRKGTIIALLGNLFGAVVLILVLTWAVGAQGPEPGEREPPRGPHPVHPTGVRFDEKPALRPAALGDLGAQDVSAAVALGQPGLSFRYLETFGVTEQAYIADVQHLNHPSGLFIDGSDNLYVAEEHGARMLKYRTSDGANLLSIGTAGLQYIDEYVFSDPKDVAVDGSGNIWVVDNHRATQYDASGNFSQVFPDWDNSPWDSGDDNEHFDTPCGIAFDSAGRMYVSDLENHRVQVYTFVGGSPVYSTTIGVTGVSGNDNAHFNWPARIVIDSSDRLYVADVENFRVQRCTYAAGWTCAAFHGTGIEGSGSNELSRASGLGIDSSDNIYIADDGNGRVKKCDSGGSCSTFASGFDWPADVAVDSSGNVYVSDFFECTVRKYNSSGGSQGIFAGTSDVPYLTDNSHFNTPYGVAVDGSGNIYLSTRRGYRVLKLNASGTAQWAAGTAGVWGNDNVHFGQNWSGPNDVAVDSSGNVYVADTGNHRIQIYNSSGSYVITLGNYGSGDYQFDAPYGVAVDRSGNIYVADRSNHRVQIYNSSRVYVATIGVTGVPGTDNNHFDEPYGVAVDSSGNIYVADGENRRVQVFNSSRVYVRTLGTTGEWGDDFDHFSQPRDVAVDAQGRVYVADAWNNRVQVFDSSGAYLTTIGGAWGSGSGQFRGAIAVDVDSAGNVYVADVTNHRIQKFAPGVPGWEQVNINGFGDADNWGVLALEVFNEQLYAGTGTDSTGADLWHTSSPWTAVMTDGFGTTNNTGINDLIEFDGQLYAGTPNEVDGGQVWRSSNGSTWNQVVSTGFGDSTNSEVIGFVVFSDRLYASTWSYTDTHGTEIWRSNTGNSGDWAQVVSNGFGDADNEAAIAKEVFSGNLYVGTFNLDSGAEVWRSSTGNSGDWTQVNDDGFGEGADNGGVISFAVFNGALYASTTNCNTGGQVWRTSNGAIWTKVVNAGFGDINNCSIGALTVFEGNLYATTYNHPWNDSQTGIEVWRTEDSTTWTQINPDGFGDNNTKAGFAVAVFDNHLYFGTWNRASGGKIWLLNATQPVYLPIIMNNYP